MEKVSFDNTADSDQCRPRGWHHQLQIAPPPSLPSLTPSEELVIALTRAAGRERNDLGKEAPLFGPFLPLLLYSLLFSKFDNALADRSHFHNWARRYYLSLLSAVP